MDGKSIKRVAELIIGFGATSESKIGVVLSAIKGVTDLLGKALDEASLRNDEIGRSGA